MIKIKETDRRKVFEALQQAAHKILEVYQGDIQVEFKGDRSPLTLADKASNEVITSFLKKEYPKTPILSEESKILPYDERKNWNEFWMLDPLDGTKEFIKKNGEFCICLALIENNKGQSRAFIYHVTEGIVYWAEKGFGAHKLDMQTKEETKLQSTSSKESNTMRIVGSRSHHSKENGSLP